MSAATGAAKENATGDYRGAAKTAPAAIALAGLSAVLLAGCAPRTLWIAKSPDRRQTVRLLDGGGLHRVLLDDREIGRHDGVAVSTFAFSADGRQWAYAARRGEAWEIRSSLGNSGEWDGIGGILFSPAGDRLAFSAERNGSWHAVLDFRPGPAYQELLPGAFLFSPDGKRFACAGRRAGKVRVSVDQELGPELDGVAGLAFDAASRPLHAARRGDSAFLARDGVEGPASDAIGDIAYSAAADRLAYAARNGSTWRLIVDGRPGAPFAGARDPVFRPDGGSLAWIARIGNRDVMIQDGVQAERDYARIRPGSLVFPSGSEKPAYRAVTDEGKQVLVLGGEEGPPFEGLSEPVFGPLGESGYAGLAGKAWSVILGGKELARETWAGSPVFGAGGRYIYAARRPEGLCVVTAESSHCFDVLLEDTLVFGPDGRSWGCLAGRNRDGKLRFVVDGRPVKELDLGEVAGAALRGAPQGGVNPAREWVRAELALLGPRDSR